MKVRRKIMALGTALAMAFVMIASLVMVTDVKADEPVQNVSFKMVVPEADSAVEENPNSPGYPKGPTFSDISDGVMFVEGYWQSDSQFDGTMMQVGDKFEKGKTYYVMADLFQDAGYTLDDSATVTVNGKPVKNIKNADYGAQVIIEFTVGGESGGGESGGGDIPASVPVKDGYADQTVAPGSAITIGFDKDFSNFNNGTEQGKVYIDGNEVPGQYVNATPGSTIIQIAEEYMKQLSEGAHKMVVKFLDGTEGEASFTVSSSAAASTAANGTSGTASSTAATTTKVTSPKTADVLPIAGIALVFVGATAIGVIAIRRKNS